MPSPILQIRNSVSHMNACINFSILGKVDIHEQLDSEKSYPMMDSVKLRGVQFFQLKNNLL